MKLELFLTLVLSTIAKSSASCASILDTITSNTLAIPDNVLREQALGIITNLTCASEGSTAIDKAQTACALSRAVFAVALSNGFHVPVYLDQHSPEYQNRTDVNWSDNCWQQARCIVSPRSAAEVSDLMKIVSFTSSRFAVRSGGHNPNVGFGSVNSTGILVDMVNINQIAIQSDKKTAYVGAGQRNGQVFNTLQEHGFYANGGKDPNPGLGGLMSGGGITWLASQYGMAANGIMNAEVVLADGSIVNANKSSNSDLYWAIKGGGPNYGIITRYDLELISSPRVWYEFRIYAPDQISHLLNAAYAYQVNAEKDDYSGLVFQSFAAMTIVGFIYAKPTPYPPVFSPFYNITYQTSFVNSTIGSLAQLSQAVAGAGGQATARYAIYAVSLRPDTDIYNTTYAKFLQVTDQLPSNLRGAITYGIQPVTSNTVQCTQRNGGLPLNLSAGMQTWFAGTIAWTSDNDTETVYKALETVGQYIEQSSQSRGKLLPFRFMNDANYKQKVLQGYGDENVQKLWATAKRYDPRGIFQKQQNNGFLLSHITS